MRLLGRNASNANPPTGDGSFALSRCTGFTCLLMLSHDGLAFLAALLDELILIQLLLHHYLHGLLQASCIFLWSSTNPRGQQP